MTAPRNGPLPPRTRDEIASDNFVRGITEAPLRCSAIAISDPTGHYHTAFCAACDWYGRERWHGADGKSEAQQEASWHNAEHEGDAA